MHWNMFLIAIILKKMCNKAADMYPSIIQFVFECYKTQEICDKAVGT